MIYDVIIIGAGPAGLEAADAARKNGAGAILLIDRGMVPGGILLQCVHDGFGQKQYLRPLTGPTYAQRAFDKIKGYPEITLWLDTVVIAVTAEKEVTCVNPERGLQKVQGKTIVLASGCRERTRGAIRTPGQRLAGIITAGAAQRLVNCFGFVPGKKIVILGSGDIGLIMARRMTLEGCEVKAVLEICPFTNGLQRNIVQCLEDYGIPLYLSHTVTNICGKERVERITVAKVDNNRQVIAGTEFDIECDTLLLSVGLVPENVLYSSLPLEMSKVTGGPKVDQHGETTLPGFFAAGNVVQVHDLVDCVADEAANAGKFAAQVALKGDWVEKDRKVIKIKAGKNVHSCVPEFLNWPKFGTESIKFFIRVAHPAEDVHLVVKSGNEVFWDQYLPIVRPGEMISLPIGERFFWRIGKEVTVGVE